MSNTKITTLHLKGDTETDVYPNVIQDNLPASLSEAMNKGLATQEDLGLFVKYDTDTTINGTYTFKGTADYSSYVIIDKDGIEFNAGTLDNKPVSSNFPKATLYTQYAVGGGFIGQALVFHRNVGNKIYNRLDGYGFHVYVNDSTYRYVTYHETGIQYFNPDDFNTNYWNVQVPTNTSVKYRCKFRDDIKDGNTYTIAFEENESKYTHFVTIRFGGKYYYAFQTQNGHKEAYIALSGLPKGTFLCRGSDDSGFTIIGITLQGSDNSLVTICDNGTGGTLKITKTNLNGVTIEDTVTKQNEI